MYQQGMNCSLLMKFAYLPVIKMRILSSVPLNPEDVNAFEPPYGNQALDTRIGKRDYYPAVMSRLKSSIP